MHVIETDVRMSKDGVVFICHDNDFTRLCTPESIPKDSVTIGTTDSNNFPKFKEEIPVEFSDGLTYKRKSTDAESHTKLEDVFKEIDKDVVLHVDIKDTNRKETTIAVVNLVKKYNR